MRLIVGAEVLGGTSDSVEMEGENYDALNVVVVVRGVVDWSGHPSFAEGGYGGYQRGVGWAG